MESSPTRTTRDLLLKVVPTAAHVSFHLVFEPSQTCSPRPLAGCSFRPSSTPYSGSVTESSNVHGPTGSEPVHRDPILPGFHSGHEGEGRLSSWKTQLDCDLVDPPLRGAAGLITGRWRGVCEVHSIHGDPLCPPRGVLWALEAQGRREGTRPVCTIITLGWERSSFGQMNPAAWGSERRDREPEPDEVTHAGDTIGGLFFVQRLTP